MTENPFGDTSVEVPTKRRYLLLLSAGKHNLTMVQTVLQNIKKEVDEKSATLWIDAKGLGVFIETDLVAGAIWQRAVTGLTHDLEESVKDMLILEVGEDWMARRDAPTTHWLATHVGEPLPVPRVSSRRP